MNEICFLYICTYVIQWKYFIPIAIFVTVSVIFPVFAIFFGIWVPILSFLVLVNIVHSIDYNIEYPLYAVFHVTYKLYFM